MEISREAATKLAALIIAVGRFTAELDAGYEGDIDALKRINRMAQDAAVGSISELAFDAIDLCDQAQRAEGVIHWDELTGKGD